MSTVKANDVKYFDGFDDPAAEMIIEVTDKTRFRVHSHTLRTQSAFFRSMPAYSKELSGPPSEQVVHLDTDSFTFGGLLSFLNDGSEARDKFCWKKIEQIVRIADRYQFDSVPDLVSRVAVRLLRRANVPPAFSIFQFAAQNDQLDLARLAISRFGWCTELEEDPMGIANITCREFCGVPGEYTAALFQAMTRCWTGVNQDWKRISDNFDIDGEL